MSGDPWAACVALSPDRVRAILSEQLGRSAGSVVFLAEGWDNVVFEVVFEAVLAEEERGSPWLLRFPKRAAAAEALRVEMALLPLIAPLLPVAIPRYELRGEPSPLSPHGFGGYRKLPGLGGDRFPGSPAFVPRLAAPLGELLAKLHAVPVALPLRAGVPSRTPYRTIARLRERVVERVHLVREAVPRLAARAARFLEAAPPAEHAGEPRLIHGDFTRTHVLLREPVTGDAPLTVSGVIDWSDAEVGDPAVDLAGLFHWGGEALFRAALEHYDSPDAAEDAGLAERARFIATCVGFYDVFHGLATGRGDRLVLGFVALEANLPG